MKRSISQLPHDCRKGPTSGLFTIFRIIHDASLASTKNSLRCTPSGQVEEKIIFKRATQHRPRMKEGDTDSVHCHTAHKSRATHKACLGPNCRGGERRKFSRQTLRTQKGLLNYSNPQVEAEEHFLPDGNPHRRVLIIITHLSRVKLSSSAFNVVLCRFPVTRLVNFYKILLVCLSSRLFLSSSSSSSCGDSLQSERIGMKMKI